MCLQGLAKTNCKRDPLFAQAWIDTFAEKSRSATLQGIANVVYALSLMGAYHELLHALDPMRLSSLVLLLGQMASKAAGSWTLHVTVLLCCRTSTNSIMPWHTGIGCHVKAELVQRVSGRQVFEPMLPSNILEDFI